MADKRMDDDGLELFFAAAREARPEPSAAFLARLAEDGLAVQAERAAPVAPERRGGGALGGALMAILGGWRGLGGLATAAAAGLWLGFAGSEQLVQVASGYVGSTSVAANDSGSVFLNDGDILALAGN